MSIKINSIWESKGFALVPGKIRVINKLDGYYKCVWISSSRSSLVGYESTYTEAVLKSEFTPCRFLTRKITSK